MSYIRLNKMQFAKLVAHCVSNGMSAGEYEVNTLDDLCYFEIVEDNKIYPQASDVNKLMELMAEGTKKIEAIKCHRMLTGWGLKESKEEVEKYWVAKQPLPTPSEATLGDILRSKANS